ncbi:hypothetical protein D4764_04G0013740 [Takifugu flavidus]|uniref:Uncharacterized protein n=1 Tax=Takifugu flavidus TaxID=433684 RepID=A0A5C6NAR0_9TELE|nr:hypothetical protein D4764_04G0013740 [Takifugu flavidus]
MLSRIVQGAGPNVEAGHIRPTVRSLGTTAFAEKLCILHSEFTQRFADFDIQKSRFELLSNPFAAEVEKAPTNLQMELIKLQCSDALKSKYDAVGASQFPQFITDTMPQLHTEAALMLSMFGSTS